MYCSMAAGGWSRSTSTLGRRSEWLCRIATMVAVLLLSLTATNSLATAQHASKKAPMRARSAWRIAASTPTPPAKASKKQPPAAPAQKPPAGVSETDGPDRRRRNQAPAVPAQKPAAKSKPRRRSSPLNRRPKNRRRPTWRRNRLLSRIPPTRIAAKDPTRWPRSSLSCFQSGGPRAPPASRHGEDAPGAPQGASAAGTRARTCSRGNGNGGRAGHDPGAGTAEFRRPGRCAANGAHWAIDSHRRRLLESVAARSGRADRIGAEH